MNETIDPVIYNQDRGEAPWDKWVNYWQSVSRGTLPRNNGPVWGFCPEIGNDEEGYGMVMVVRFQITPFARDPELDWLDAYGRQIRVTLWTPMNTPLLPREPTWREEQN